LAPPMPDEAPNVDETPSSDTSETASPPSIEQAKPLSFVEVLPRDLRPAVVGYGLAKPARVWQAVARVDGRTTETHPRLKAGELIDAGTLLVQIDPTDYELEADRLAAEADALRAQLEELQRQEENDKATLAVETESMELAANEVDRGRELVPSGAMTRSEFDRLQRDYLAARRSVQSLENSLNLIPAQRRRLQANLAAVGKRSSRAQRDLEHTSIHAPFDCRLAVVNIEPGQYVATDERPFEVHGIDRVEVEAMLPLDDIATLVGRDQDTDELAAMAMAAAEGLEDPQADEGRVASQSLVRRLIEGLDATVRVESGEVSRQWNAEITRVREQIEQRTRSVGVVVTVVDDQPNRPPLLEGMFCEVVIRGHEQKGQLVVPVSAPRNGRVYVIDGDDRLRARDVRKRFLQESMAVVAGPLEAGDRVVVADPSPAVEGSLVKPSLSTEHKAKDGDNADAEVIRINGGEADPSESAAEGVAGGATR
ncbi:MAG: HlyD family efflux transporter periplasmic adaptor subunit, partial [Planctomycetota bacterium]